MGARHALLLFRVALYATAVALIVWLLAGRGEAAEVAEYTGTTSRGDTVVLTLDGASVALEGRLVTSCQGSRPGERWYTSWAPGRLDGAELRIAERSGGDMGDGWTSSRSYTVSGRLDGDRVSGRISLFETWDGGPQGWTRCAGTVAFSAQR